MHLRSARGKKRKKKASRILMRVYKHDQLIGEESPPWASLPSILNCNLLPAGEGVENDSRERSYWDLQCEPQGCHTIRDDTDTEHTTWGTAAAITKNKR